MCCLLAYILNDHVLHNLATRLTHWLQVLQLLNAKVEIDTMSNEAEQASPLPDHTLWIDWHKDLTNDSSGVSALFHESR